MIELFYQDRLHNEYAKKNMKIKDIYELMRYNLQNKKYVMLNTNPTFQPRYDGSIHVEFRGLGQYKPVTEISFEKRFGELRKYIETLMKLWQESENLHATLLQASHNRTTTNDVTYVKRSDQKCDTSFALLADDVDINEFNEANHEIFAVHDKVLRDVGITNEAILESLRSIGTRKWAERARGNVEKKRVSSASMQSLERLTPDYEDCPAGQQWDARMGKCSSLSELAAEDEEWDD